jgi:hypothetical protein
MMRRVDEDWRRRREQATLAVEPTGEQGASEWWVQMNRGSTSDL